MRIGILGGTFDPPHVGHLTVARAALDQLQLDEVLFLPANRNPLKTRTTTTSGRDRLGMVEALIRHESRMAVSDMELTRGGLSYTVDTLGELMMVAPAEYWFIMGADSLRGLPEWKNPQRLMKLARVAVAVRPPLIEEDVVARIPEDFRPRVDLISIVPIDISSTELRERLQRNQNVSAWIPEDVLKYIATNRLYRN
jgi:nicotinate-nucleotide adenylyltransferase